MCLLLEHHKPRDHKALVSKKSLSRSSYADRDEFLIVSELPLSTVKVPPSPASSWKQCNETDDDLFERHSWVTITIEYSLSAMKFKRCDDGMEVT